MPIIKNKIDDIIKSYAKNKNGTVLKAVLKITLRKKVSKNIDNTIKI